MGTLSFHVEFPPTPWKRPSGTTQRFDAQLAEKSAFNLLVLQQIKQQLPTISTEPFFKKHLALTVQIVFFLKRPLVSKLNFPTNKSDIDNLSKFVLDSLQTGQMSGRIWYDDGQIIDLSAKKRWADSDSIFCSIGEY